MKEKLINFRYVFYPFLAFFFGIVMARKLFAGNLEIILLVLGLFAIITTFLLIKKLYKPLAVLIAFFFLGNGFYFLGENSFNRKEYMSKVSVVGRITDDIIDYDYSKVIVLDEVKIDGEKQSNLRLTIKNASSITIGDFVAFEGNVEKSKPFTLNSFNSTDLRDNVGYYAEARFQDIVFTGGYTKVDEKIRMAVKDSLYSSMSDKNAAISYAVLFGDKSGIDDLTEVAYQNSGIIHVLTVSGLHVGFLISLVYFLLKLCKLNKYVRFAVTTIFIFLYAFLCGFSPSVLRAGIMAIVLMLSKLFMRRYDSLNSLGTAGFAICMFSPLTALDVGFQMSFFCVCGIIMLAPMITKFLAKIIPYKIASLIALSLSAQIGILPFTASFGATINILSVFANLFVVPAFSIIYPFLFVVSFLSTFLPFLCGLLKVADYAFVAVNAIANFFGSTNLSIKLSPFKTSIIALYFITIMSIGKFVLRKPLIKFAMFCALALIMTVTFGLFLIPSKSQNAVYYLGNKSGASVVLENDSGERLVVGNSFMLSRYLSAYNIQKIDGFVATSYLGSEDLENLAQKGVRSFIGDKQNKNSPYFEIVEENKIVSFGDYQICFVSDNETSLGVNISFANYNIFLATTEKVDYNDSIIKNISPNIVFAKNIEQNNDFAVATQYKSEFSDFSLMKEGNMKLVYKHNRWIQRGID